MGNMGKKLLEKALQDYKTFSETFYDRFVFHDYIFITDNVALFKEIAKAEAVEKDEYGPGLVALVLSDLGQVDSPTKEIDNSTLINDFLEKNDLNENDTREIWNYINFLKANRPPVTAVEKILRDARYIHLGLPDALERLELLRIEDEKLNNKIYTELEWLEKCKQYFINHSFDSHYCNRKFGAVRSRNYFELEKRIDKLSADDIKEKRTLVKENGTDSLSDKEGEDMFKIAFRNSVNLVALADRKAGMLIQINTLLAGVVFTFGVKKYEESTFYLLPTAVILIGSALTIFYGILASKPLKNSFYHETDPDKSSFFFGSFDKLDPGFGEVSWEKYSSDITALLKGNKKYVFEELIKESFQVRKVLSKKFGYLSIAYKVFFAGLLLGILGFLSLLIYEYFHELNSTITNNSTPF